MKKVKESLQSEDVYWDYYSGLPNPSWYEKVKEENTPTYDVENNVYRFADTDSFTPMYSPIEMTVLGVFGGNYFGNVEVNKNWLDCVPEDFLDEDVLLNKEYLHERLLSTTYNTTVNKYQVKCGMDYHGWVSSGWIHEQDPYGWFNWYINFFYGRRSTDDKRQISRWKSFVSRHSAMLKSMCAKSNREISDESFAAKTRQGLLHWSYKVAY
jgi:hypothetical protein